MALSRKSCLKQWFQSKYLDLSKRCSKLCVLAEMGLFWQKLFKTVCFVRNGLILPKAAQNRVFWPKWLYLGKSCSKQCFCAKWLDFGKSCSKLCVLAKMALSWAKAAQNRLYLAKGLKIVLWAWFWQRLHKTVCLGQNDLILARAAKNGAFREKYLDFRKICSKPCAWKWVYFGKGCSKLCVLCEMAWFWQKLLKTVCFVWNGLILAKAALKWLYLGKSCPKQWF